MRWQVTTHLLLQQILLLLDIFNERIERVEIRSSCQTVINIVQDPGIHGCG